MTLADGTDAFVTVRDVPETNAQLAFIQPVRRGALRLAAGREPRDHAAHLHRARARPPRRRRLVSRPGGRGAAKQDDFAGRPHRGLVRLPRLALESRARPRALVGRRCIGSSAGCRRDETMAFRTIANRCTPMTISAPPSIAIFATARRDSIRASACAMPTAHWIGMRLRGHITPRQGDGGALPHGNRRRRAAGVAALALDANARLARRRRDYLGSLRAVGQPEPPGDVQQQVPAISWTARRRHPPRHAL